MADKDVDALYSLATQIDQGDESKKKEAFRSVLSYTKKSEQAKILSAQIIAQHASKFPEHEVVDESLNALIDLCEDGQQNIRIWAIKGLQKLCRDLPENVSKVAYVLVQLLAAAEEDKESNLVKTSLQDCLKQDGKSTLETLFEQIKEGHESVRAKAISFLKQSVAPQLSKYIQKPEDNEAVFEKITSVMTDVSEEEFRFFMDMVGKLTVSNQNEYLERVLELAKSQYDFSSDFEPENKERLQRLTSSLEVCVPFYKKGADTSSALQYLLTKVLPVVDKIPPPYKTNLARVAAEISAAASNGTAAQCITPLFDFIQGLFPKEEDPETKIPFSLFECGMFMFHQLGSKVSVAVLGNICGYYEMTGQPSDMVGLEERKTKLEKWKKQLTYLEEEVAKHKSDLVKMLTTLPKGAGAANEETNKKRENINTALKVAYNLKLMLTTLKKQKPVFIKPGSITLSWKKSATTGKRKAEESSSNEESPAKKQRTYQPPQRQGTQRGRTTSLTNPQIRSETTRGRGGQNGQRGGGGRGRFSQPAKRGGFGGNRRGAGSFRRGGRGGFRGRR